MSLANTMLPFDNAHPAPQLYEKVAQQLSQYIQALDTKKTGAGQ